jgi:hypothetical protein
MNELVLGSNNDSFRFHLFQCVGREGVTSCEKDIIVFVFL